MKPETKAEMRAEMPEDRMPDPVTILDRLESMIASGLHIGVIARRSGLSEEHINDLLDFKKRSTLGVDDRGSMTWGPKKDRDSLFQLRAWLGTYDAERRQQAREYTEIETGLYIAALGMEALEKKRLFHLIGAYGISKTLTLKRLAEKNPLTHESPGAVYVALTDEDRTIGQVYNRISDALRLNEKFQARGRSIGQRVRNTLRPGDLIIADNANYAFEHGTWATLQDIYDESPASLLMVSNPQANGFVKKNQEELGAFLSRARTRSIEKNVAADGEQYAKALGYTCAKTIEEAGKMVSHSGARGGMRVLAKAFEDAEQKAASKGVSVDVAMLREAAKINSVFFR